MKRFLAFLGSPIMGTALELAIIVGHVIGALWPDDDADDDYFG